ncbi:hypothetical protein HrrHc1_185 [Halorubrum phage Hardycor1]|nr:hypothetical protein HrrHc1_185 [Halorubrum phage Hardycor1]
MSDDGRYRDEADEFEFEADDAVLVRIRENRTSGPLRAKFLARCVGFDGPQGPHTFGGVKAVLAPAWTNSATGRLSFRYYEAEFEQVDDPDEVRF